MHGDPPLNPRVLFLILHGTDAEETVSELELSSLEEKKVQLHMKICALVDKSFQL